MSTYLIAGGGIGGLTAALALADIGISVDLFERAAAPSEIGAGLQLSPNACRHLRHLGVLEAVAKTAFQPRGIRVRNARTGATLSYLPLDDAERRWGAPYLVARRSDLQRVLHDAATSRLGITLHYGTAIAGFGTTATGVTVTTAQGALRRTLFGDALIGADGVRSAVRSRLIDGADPATETGRTAWRAVVATDDQSLASQQETGLWLGRDAHLVHYPLGDGRLNVVAITRDRMAVDPEAIWSQPGDPALIERRFARWHRTPRALLAAAKEWTTWPLFDRAPLPSWNAGPVALLGDAAHPILPFLAQGAAQAIEDAIALADAVSSTPDPRQALARYSQVRSARVGQVQESARQLGRIYHLAGPMALARDASMKLLGPSRLLQRYDWLYGS